jgi:hypothetical protein
VSTFNDTDEALTKIRGGNVPFDIYFPSYDQISKMVTAKLIRPINRLTTALLVTVVFELIALVVAGFGSSSAPGPQASGSLNPLLSLGGSAALIAVGMVLCTGLVGVFIALTLRGTRPSAVQSATGFFYLAVITTFTPSSRPRSASRPRVDPRQILGAVGSPPPGGWLPPAFPGPGLPAVVSVAALAALLTGGASVAERRRRGRGGPGAVGVLLYAAPPSCSSAVAPAFDLRDRRSTVPGTSWPCPSPALGPGSGAGEGSSRTGPDGAVRVLRDGAGGVGGAGAVRGGQRGERQPGVWPAVVSGGWTLLAVWTHGVLPSSATSRTGLMILVPRWARGPVLTSGDPPSCLARGAAG